MHEFATILEQATRPDAYPAVLATLVQVTGSSYRRMGARRWIGHDEVLLGSISGGCLEEDLLARARAMLAAEPPRAEVITYDTTAENDLVWGVGLGCHGVVHVLLEPLASRPDWVDAARQRLDRRQPLDLWVRWSDGSFGTSLAPAGECVPAGVFVNRIHPGVALVVAGAGDDARPLVQLAHALGWTVHVVDPRPAMAVPARFPEAASVRCLPPTEVASAFPWDPWTAAVIMTHHYRFDRPLLERLMSLELPYLGLLGPRARAERLLQELRDASHIFTPAQLSRLHAPVGLDLGGDGPTQVALSILAEIQAVFGQRDGRPLRERQTPIHAA